MFEEEFQFPRQLLDIERQPVREVRGRGERLASPLEQINQAYGVTIERRVAVGWCGLHVRLHRHIAEVFERQNTEVGFVAQGRRNRDPDLTEELGDVDKRKRRVVDGPCVNREHERGPARWNHTEVAPI